MLATALGAGTAAVPAQTAAAPAALTLGQVFAAAWSRQPEAAALAARRAAAQAQQQAAQAWTPEPLALELRTRTDRLNRQRGAQELEAGLAIPLWLPGVRARSQALALAEGRAVDSLATAAQLQLAATVREAWWTWQRARAEAQSAQAHLDSAQRLAADVARRLDAGDLARSDQHLAEGAVAAAAAALAQARAAAVVSWQQLRTLAGASTDASGPDAGGGPADPGAEPEPDASVAAAAVAAASAAAAPAGHGALLALQDRVAVAQGQAALVATQSRANPELVLATTRERGMSGEAWQQTLSVAVRIPLGAGAGHAARTAAARAEASALQAQLQLAQARLAGEHAAARVRMDAARWQLAAAERRAQLARESRGFFDKSFRLGETDLPTRLRSEAEAAEADRQAGRARVELAAALSALRQALGLLPP
jgi:cobalt-zinc-cadmium efflux system outer membrane protein